MIFGPILKLRDKITRKRHQLTEDEEKPFLEHLEDLRKTITRIVVTLGIMIIACFVYHKKFFELAKKPLRDAGLMEHRERNLPQAIADMDSDEQQPAWWRIHGTARGMADLEGRQREIFLQHAATNDFTRRFAEALLLYHAADALPEQERDSYLQSAAAQLPEADRTAVLDYAAQLTKAKTPPSLEKPHDIVEVEAFAPAETFMLAMKLSLFAGIVLSFPLLFYFLLEFILPGLTQRERKLLFPALSIGFGLFLLGVLFAFYFVIPRALDFFHEFGAELGIKDRWRIGQYISFVVSFTLIFGFAFELPVVVMVMVKLGLLTSAVMRKTRAWAVIIMVVASAILTPTGDALTMSLLAAPMIIMYEACIWLAWLHERKERRLEEEERRRGQERRAALIGVAGVEAARPGTEPDASPEHADSSGASDHSEPTDESGSSGMSGVTVPGDTHPHHPESTASPDDDYEQYLRDHSGYHDDPHHHHEEHSAVETHTESVPVEERTEPAALAPDPSPSESPAAENTPSEDISDPKTQNQT
jgi:sec-independent protein translocase protein TatC